MKWHVTFERVTDESAEHGDAEERGYVDKDLSLRDALHAIDQHEGTRRADSHGVHASDSDIGQSRWFSLDYGRDYLTGDFHSYGLHPTKQPTRASMMRVARLLGCYGANR